MRRRIPVPLVPSWLRWAGVVAVAAAIFYLSIVTFPPEQVAPKPDYVPLDKWRHFLAYAAFGGAIAYAIADRRDSTARKAAAVLAVAVLYGVGIEAGQSLIPFRYFSVGDAIANAIGAVLSLAWYAVESRARFVPIGGRAFD